METDATRPATGESKHPTLAELKDPSHPQVSHHLQSCSMCRAIVANDISVPVVLDMPKGLVSENAFRWPADPIAKGGMAQIFAGEDRRLGRTVILKAPREDDNLPPGMADMFQRRVAAEARILAKLQHPAIVTIYELGKASVGWPFCVLQRVEGIALRDRLDELSDAEKDGKPRTRERLELLSNLVSIAEALAYAHERRVVHRDCTPNNILLGKRGEATLIDWGIARDLDAPGGADAVLNDEPPSASGRMVTISAGTPPYLPLEQTQGRQADPSFDVYSFGVTLYEVVSGRTPFEWVPEKSPQGRARQLDAFLEWLKSDDSAPAAMAKDAELSGIIAKAMHKDSAKRFTSDELVRALKQYLTGDLVFSHRYSASGRLSRWVRTHRAATVSLLFVVTAGVAAVLGWGYIQRQEAEQAKLESDAAKARADAADAASAADKATQLADEAQKREEAAIKAGRNADKERKEAEDAKRNADSLRDKAQRAAKAAQGNAEEAHKAQESALAAKDRAESERDAAKAAQSAAEAARDAALSSRAEAEKARDAARTSASNAEKERDAANRSAATAAEERSAAEKERDAARTTATNAEKERDAAVSARASIEKERDEARKELVLLTAKLKELESKNNSPGPPPDPTPSP